MSVGEGDVGDGDRPSVKEQPAECSYCIISGARAISPISQNTRKTNKSGRNEQSRCE